MHDRISSAIKKLFPIRAPDRILSSRIGDLPLLGGGWVAANIDFIAQRSIRLIRDPFPVWRKCAGGLVERAVDEGRKRRLGIEAQCIEVAARSCLEIGYDPGAIGRKTVGNLPEGGGQDRDALCAIERFDTDLPVSAHRHEEGELPRIAAPDKEAVRTGMEQIGRAHV